MVDVLDDEGNITGEVMNIRDVHAYYKYHKSAHVWIIYENSVLLQLRSNDVRCEKNKWDISASGHLNSGEDSIEAGIRETYEELGIKLESKDMHLIFSTKINEFENNEFRDVYLVNKKIDIDKCLVPNNEVSELKWMNINDYISLINNDDLRYVYRSKSYMNELVKYLKGIYHE